TACPTFLESSRKVSRADLVLSATVCPTVVALWATACPTVFASSLMVVVVSVVWAWTDALNARVMVAAMAARMSVFFMGGIVRHSHSLLNRCGANRHPVRAH